MKLVVRFVKGLRCEGCGDTGWVDEKSMYCPACLGIYLKVEERKEKLQSTLRVKFAAIGERVKEQLREFAR
jgi:Zn finger protein HypA/HybF involved in hydrogenase expression